MSAPTDPLVLSCEHCGAEVQVVGDRTAVDVNMIIEDWNLEHTDCGRSPELSRWGECVRQTPSALELLEQIVGPRPSWAPAANDRFGDVASYGSEPARVHIRNHAGWTVGTEYTPAHIDVQACMYRPLDGGPAVGMTTVKRAQETWVRRATRMSTDEARQLAATLVAAADLAESA